jgi:hypothetical protein
MTERSWSSTTYRWLSVQTRSPGSAATRLRRLKFGGRYPQAHKTHVESQKLIADLVLVDAEPGLAGKRSPGMAANDDANRRRTSRTVSGSASFVRRAL